MSDFDNKLKNASSDKNELNGISTKVKEISSKGLTRELINQISIFNGVKYFTSGIFQNYLVFIPAKKYISLLNMLVALHGLISGKNVRKNIKDITKSDSNFAPTFVDHHLLWDIYFNEPCLINNVPKKLINIYLFINI